MNGSSALPRWAWVSGQVCDRDRVGPLTKPHEPSSDGAGAGWRCSRLRTDLSGEGKHRLQPSGTYEGQGMGHRSMDSALQESESLSLVGVHSE